MRNDPLPNPRFTGVFIPVEILEMSELTPNEMFLLSWVDALYCNERKGCYASNAYFSQKLHLKENTITVMLTKLKRLGLIEQVSYDGRVRIIRACKEMWFKEKSSESQSDYDLNHSQTVNKIIVRPSSESQSLPYIESKDYSKEERERKADASHSLSSSKVKVVKQSYGEYKNVQLSDEEHSKLKEKLTDPVLKEYIEKVDSYCEQTGKKYKSYSITIFKWYTNDFNKPKPTSVVKKSHQEKLNSYFKSGEIYNGYYIYIDDKSAAIQPSQGQGMMLTISYSEHGFMEQFISACRKRNIIPKDGWN